jgi:deoxycytidylate deaminase
MNYKQALRHAKMAASISRLNDHPFNIGAVIFNRAGLISIGCNHYHKSVKHHHPRFRKFRDSIHAEVDAIIRARTNVKGMSMLVVRTTKNSGVLKNAEPCPECVRYLQYVELKKVFYSTNDGTIEQIKL